MAAPLAAQDITTQFWPEIDTFVRISDNIRIFVPVSRTREGNRGSDQDGTAGIYVDYYTLPFATLNLVGPAYDARARRLSFRLGYGYTASGDGQPATNTLTAESTGRLLLPWDLLASDRNRFDLNFAGGEFDPRYRNRLRLERNTPVGTSSLTPYVYGEFFYSFNRGRWLKTRVTAGVEAHLWERYVPELYFQRDYGIGSSPDVRGFGLVLSIYLR